MSPQPDAKFLYPCLRKRIDQQSHLSVPPGQFIHGALQDNPAAVEQDHAITKFLHLSEEMRTEQHG
ncbi:MAG: hypothetical protein WC485_10945, partial [Opitutaceae bacterium]